MPRSRRECEGLWRQAQRSPSIIGFNVSGDLAKTLVITLGGRQFSAADVRHWPDGAAPESEERVALELIFMDIPAGFEEQQVGEASSAAIEAHFRESRLGDFRAKLARH